MLQKKLQTLVEMGFKCSTISREAGVDNSDVARWLKGERTLSEKRQAKLQVWLDDFCERLKTNIL